MNVKDIVKMANSMPGDYSEKEVLDFFKVANIGHWPSEKGNLEINMENGKIVFNITDKKIDSGVHNLTPAGKIWLLGHFFEHFKPQAWLDVTTVTDDSFKGGFASSKKFKEKITERLAGKARFIKDNDSRFAFVERVRENSDGSLVYSYDTTNLDKDDSYKFILMIPGKKTFVYIYEQSDDYVSLSFDSVSNKDLEKMEPWERAYYLSNLNRVSTFGNNGKKVKAQALEAAFLLTADTHEQEIIKKLVGEL